ncbi:hypothetical protein NDU88_002375 [Pleurodeles waltl]|uniref:Uncharacterized protein n=1 Tax=Pleurodeles waltl TaxID=8319 RepID=A0AAV7TMY2_PLEWA|nr:hypothetical protein NDU88_002375 [Pleurodeles waltl]
MARSTVLDPLGPPCIKEEANPASVRRIAATTEYCVLLQRSRADCGVTAGNNAELSSESDAAALSMDEVAARLSRSGLVIAPESCVGLRWYWGGISFSDRLVPPVCLLAVGQRGLYRPMGAELW